MTGVYYNENDPFAAQWLRNLMAAGHIPEGEVDERSIELVRAVDLYGFRQCHFFAGIAGWSRALQFAGWPDDWEVWTGSCPCQPFSAAGKKQGENDARHLWPFWRELIAERNPAIVFGEQVASPLGREWLAGVRAEMETLGYEVGAADLCAAGILAPHIRQRLWFGACKLAHTDNERQQNQGLHVRWRQQEKTTPIKSRHDYGLADNESFGRAEAANGEGADRQPAKYGEAFWSAFDLIPCADGKARRIEPGTFPLAHGIPARVGKLRAYGNAIVPQVAAEFIGAFLAA